MLNKYYYVKQVGVELEGGWKDRLPEIKPDGSVDVDESYIGEIASPPMLPKEVAKWMSRFYPSAVNGTCGLHVHVSFRRDTYISTLMERKFRDAFLAHIRAWGVSKNIIQRHPFWKRLEGENQYCQDDFKPDAQIQGDGDRYCQINFCAFRKHRTVEFRLLPMFKMQNIAISAVETVIDFCEMTLKDAPRNPAYRACEVIEEDSEGPSEVLQFDHELILTPTNITLTEEV